VDRTYSVRLTAGARHELEDLREPMRKRIRRALRALREARRPPGAKLLSGDRRPRIWRIRVGDHRVLYEIRDDQLVVLVICVGHRKQVYGPR
jgi:mRNA interferase RelE/StbE